MYARVYDFVIKHKILYSKQYGFQKNHSTTHTLLTIVERICTNLDNGNFFCGIFVDLRKAFDTVS